MRELLPVPIQPHKGQSFSVKAPPNFLERVLFASDTYIVPKKVRNCRGRRTRRDENALIPRVTARSEATNIKNALN